MTEARFIQTSDPRPASCDSTAFLSRTGNGSEQRRELIAMVSPCPIKSVFFTRCVKASPPKIPAKSEERGLHPVRSRLPDVGADIRMANNRL